MSKPNWKRRGLARPVKEHERVYALQLARLKARVEQKIRTLPPELRDFARANPGLIQ